MRLLTLIILGCLPLFSAQSLNLAVPTVGQFRADILPGDNQSFRVEGHVHDFDGGFYTNWHSNHAVGYYFTTNATDLACVKLRDSLISNSIGPMVKIVGRSSFLFRCQRDVENMRWCLEVWNVDGTGYASDCKAITLLTATASPLARAGFGLFGGSLGFLRIWTTVVELNSRPPTTAETADWVDWKFEGNGEDTSGGSHSLIEGVPLTYQVTPGLKAYSLPAVPDTPSYAPYRPLRAGHANRLKSASYSMMGNANQVVCSWRQLAGPSDVIFSDTNQCDPEIRGLIFGSYRFRLSVRDGEGNEDSSEIEVGAVAYDDNGVVIYPDERLYEILGPMKVYGSNDWDWLDERWTVIAKANWDKYVINGGKWLNEAATATIGGVTREGTVTLTVGSNQVTGTGTNFLEVFTGNRAGSAFSDARLVVYHPDSDEATYPTIVSCASDTACTLSGNWGGFGITTGTSSFSGLPWYTWMLAETRQDAEGTTVYTSAAAPTKIYGTGATGFATKFCGGGTVITHINQAIHVVEADAITTRYIASCQSETEITVRDAWTRPHIDAPGVTWARRNPLEEPGSWNANASSFVNFYDVAKAHYAFYYRTGMTKARDAARWIADNWLKFGVTSQIWRSNALSGIVLRLTVDPPEGGTTKQWKRIRELSDAMSGGFLDPSGDGFCGGVPIGELREESYCVESVALVAMYDPDSTSRANAKTKLASIYDAWQPAQLASGAFLNQYLSGDQTRVFTFSNGSATVTKHSGPDITTDYCGTASSFNSAGTISIAGGSTAITGSGTAFSGQVNKWIHIRGTLSGQPYSQLNQLTAAASDTAGTLRYKWPGDAISGSSTFRFQSSIAPFGIMPVNSSGTPTGAIHPWRTHIGQVDQDNFYWCTVNSTTQITLDKPYTGDTGTNAYRRMVGGFFPPQPYIHGIAGLVFHRAANALDGTDSIRAAGYRTMARNTSRWLFEDAAAGYSYGLPYFAETPYCRPAGAGDAPTICGDNQGTLDTGFYRAYAVETHGLFARDYLANPSGDLLTRNNTWYTAHFAFSGYSSPFAWDGWSANLLWNGNYNFNTNLLTKNYGQTFGLGEGYLWPAARLGGRQGSIPRSVTIGTEPPGDRDIVQIMVYVLSPSNRRFEVSCDTTSPCTFTVDQREGDHWYEIRYLNSEGSVVGQATSQLIRVP